MESQKEETTVYGVWITDADGGNGRWMTNGYPEIYETTSELDATMACLAVFATQIKKTASVRVRK